MSAPTAAGPIRGAFVPPGSKSLTQRFMVLAALAKGRSVIEEPLDAQDTRALAEGLAVLGAVVHWPAGGAIAIDGVDGRFPGGGTLDAAEGGTPARFLMAAACMAAAPSTLDRLAFASVRCRTARRCSARWARSCRAPRRKSFRCASNRRRRCAAADPSACPAPPAASSRRRSR
jgi:hypothetical protein